MFEVTLFSEVTFINKFFTKTARFPMYLGQGGSGKTAAQQQYANSVNKPLISLRMSAYKTPNDVMGMVRCLNNMAQPALIGDVPPWFPCWRMDGNNKVQTTTQTEGFTPILDEKGAIIPHDAVILFEEFNFTQPAVQEFIFSMLITKSCAHLKFTNGTEFIAEGYPNNGTYTKFIQKMDPLLVNKNNGLFIPFEFTPSEQAWTDYINGRKEPIADDGFPKETSSIDSDEVKTFLNLHQDKDSFFREGPSLETCREFFKGLGMLKNLERYPTMQIIAKAMLGQKNAKTLIDYVKSI